jgi:hypothetical protein
MDQQVAAEGVDSILIFDDPLEDRLIAIFELPNQKGSDPLMGLPKNLNMSIIQNSLVLGKNRGLFFSRRGHDDLISRVVMECPWQYR